MDEFLLAIPSDFIDNKLEHDFMVFCRYIYHLNKWETTFVTNVE